MPNSEELTDLGLQSALQKCTSAWSALQKCTSDYGDRLTDETRKKGCLVQRSSRIWDCRVPCRNARVLEMPCRNARVLGVPCRNARVLGVPCRNARVLGGECN